MSSFKICLQFQTKYWEQDKKIHCNQTGLEYVDVFFWVHFDCFCQSLVSGREIEQNVSTKI